jgi:type IV secretory pathway TrbL component
MPSEREMNFKRFTTQSEASFHVNNIKDNNFASNSYSIFLINSSCTLINIHVISKLTVLVQLILFKMSLILIVNSTNSITSENLLLLAKLLSLILLT